MDPALPDALTNHAGYLSVVMGQRSQDRFETAMASLDLKPIHFDFLATLSENGPTAEHSDRDELGWPDPTRTATRELKEELGVSIDPRDLRPACVFLSNSVNASSGKGQLGVCALLLARTELTYDELASRLDWASDLAQGRFEVQSLVRIPMGEHITDFAESIVEIAPRLDQHGALCIVYAARLYWEQHEVIGAFTEVFRHLDIERLAPPDVFAPQRF